MEIAFQLAGWVGTILVVYAYYLVSTNRVSGSSKMYELLNLFGAIGVGINVFHQAAWPSVALQIVWCCIAIASLIRIRKKYHIFPHHLQSKIKKENIQE